MKEVLVSATSLAQRNNITVWDVEEGKEITGYEEGASVQRTLCLLRQDYFLSVDAESSILNIWPVRKKMSEQEMQRPHQVAMPGHVSALAVSPDGCYCAAGVGATLLIWQVSTGYLFNSIEKHYRKITVVKFTDDGSHLISASEDGRVMTWLMARCLSSKPDPQPKYEWNKHTLPVTDLCVGRGGWRSRVVTASLDQMCMIYSLSSGRHLQSIKFPVFITSVAMDSAETSLFSGARNGKIYQTKLVPPPRAYTSCLDTEEMKKCVFDDRSDGVTCLAVDTSGTLLASGSSYGIKMWNIRTKECVRELRTINVSNLFFMLTSDSTFTCEEGQSLPPIESFRNRVLQRQDIENVKVTLEPRLEELWGRSNSSYMKDAINRAKEEHRELQDSYLRLADIDNRT